MRFVQRVRAIWSWLPSFRAVGETEHLPTAAQELAIVPSSLSRTVKQLEDELGIQLFDRSTKGLILNEAGRTLLTAVREAMRIVDDALEAVGGDDLRGTVAAAANADLVQAILIPAGAALTAIHPTFVFAAHVATPDEALAMLLRGDIDAAISLQPAPHPDLHTIELATWNRGMFVGADRVDTGELRHVVVGIPSRHDDDGWPAGRTRTIAAWAPDERAALTLCAGGALTTVAFDEVVRRCGIHMTRLSEPDIAPRAIFLIHRRAVGRHRRTEALIQAIRDETAS